MMDDKIDLLRRTIVAIGKASEGSLLTETQCEDLSSLDTQLHNLTEAAWNRLLDSRTDREQDYA